MPKIQSIRARRETTVLSCCSRTDFVLYRLFSVVLLLQLCLLEFTMTSSVPNLQHLLKHPQYAEALQHSQRMNSQFSSLSRNSGKRGDELEQRTSYSPSRETHSRTVAPVYQTTLNSRTVVSHTRSRPPESYPWSTLYHQSSYNSRGHSGSYLDQPKTNPMLKVSSAPRRTIETSLGNSGASSGHTGQSKEFYKVMYGSQDGIKHLKGNYGPENLSQAKVNHGVIQELEDVKLANEHFLRMRSNGRCKVPRPEVVHVKDFYPDPAKEFLPRCTLLHRCGPQAGCCESDGYQCQPKAMQEVSLNFYTLHLGMHTSEVGLENSVEKLLFVNHTECECLPVNDSPRSQDKVELKEQEQQDSHRHQDHEEQKNGVFSQPSKCRDCPDPFCKREFPDGRCSCDCFDRQKPCLRIKRGRETLNDLERRCVELGRCHIPDCEYGVYDVTAGRCPKRPDDFHRGVKNNNNNHQRSLQNPNHRWTFFERD